MYLWGWGWLQNLQQETRPAEKERRCRGVVVVVRWSPRGQDPRTLEAQQQLRRLVMHDSWLESLSGRSLGHLTVGKERGRGKGREGGKERGKEGSSRKEGL